MYFLLYSHNVVVSGKDKAAICDLQHARVMYIPNAFTAVLEKLKTMEVNQIKNSLFQNNPDLLEQYMAKLIDHKMGRYVNDPESFPELDFSYHFPGIIHSAVMEIDFESYDPIPVITDLDHCGCRHLELRIKTGTSNLSRLQKLLDIWEENMVQSIDILWEDGGTNEKEAENLYQMFQKINSVTVCNAPMEKEGTSVRFTNYSLQELERRGFKADKLILDMKYYCESLMYNTTYHQKAAIDYSGNIKNIIFDPNSFGNVNQNRLSDIVNSSEFQKLWTVNADRIEDVKDSPLRHVTYNPFPVYEKDGKYLINHLN